MDFVPLVSALGGALIGAASSIYTVFIQSRYQSTREIKNSPSRLRGTTSTRVSEKLREWEDYYDYHRPHAALDGQAPYERLVAKMRAGTSPTS
jgi:hypothetical protein